MSENNPPPATDSVTATAPLPPAPAAIPPSTPPPPRRRRGLWPALGLLGFILLAGGEAYLWRLIHTLPPPPPNLSSQVVALQSQLTALQKAPQPPPALAAAAPALPPLPPTAPPATTALDTDLSNRLGTLNALVNALQTQFNADHAAVIAMQANNADLPKVLGTVTALQTAQTADHAALATLQSDSAKLTKLTARMTVLDRLQAARAALDAGQPLGDIPNAPPALAKFSAAPPPTQAALVLAYPAAARAADAASVPGATRGTYWSVVLARLENLVTISKGGRVILGAPAAGVVAQAGDLLNAGDLAGAVAALSTLNASTQAAIGGWLAQARDLLAARAAIATLAGQS